MHPGTRLRQRLASGGIVVAPGAHDALTARIVERAGFEVVYFTGAGFSYTHLGAPDIGLVSLTETVWRVGALASATTLPIIADADTGYGNFLNVARSVREIERAGAAAIQLEDQVFPKRCGHLAGKALVTADEMVGRIQAALDSRKHPDLLIIARTDARGPAGLEAALERARQYHEAGADVLFVEAPQTREELALIARTLDAPLVANMVEGGKTPMLSAAELESMGYRLVIFPGAAVRMAAGATLRLMEVLRRTGTTAEVAEQMLSFRELNELLGLAAYQEQERRYLPDA